jgi:MFS family permease
MDRGVRKQNIVAVTASNTLAVTANGLWIMFIPLYLSSTGMSLTLIGIVFGIGALVMAACQFIGGNLADRYGRKKVMIFGRCISCCGIATILLSVCQFRESFSGPMLISAGYFILYAGSGIRGPATSMLLMESSPHRTKGRNFMVAERVLPSIPPALTVFLGSLYYESGQFDYLVGIGLIGFVVASIILAVGTVETIDDSNHDTSRQKISLIRPDAFISLLVLAFILDGVSSKGLSWYIPIYLEEQGTVFYGLLISISTLIIAFFGLLSGCIVDRYGGPSVLVPAWLLLSLVVFLFGMTTEASQLLVLYCVWVSLDTVDTSVPPVLISNHYSSSQCATWMGWFSSVKCIVLFTGPILTGYMLTLGSSVPFYFKACANLAASLLILKLPDLSDNLSSKS